MIRPWRWLHDQVRWGGPGHCRRIARRMEQQGHLRAVDRWVPQQEPEPSRLDALDGVRLQRPEDMARVLDEARAGSRARQKGET